MLKKRALIFDYDGLMVDTETCVYECWKRVFVDHRQQLDEEEWMKIVGRAEEEDFWGVLEAKLGRGVDRPILNDRRRAHFLELVGTKDLLPGVRELMAEGLRQGFVLGVASNSTVGWVNEGLERFGLRAQVSALRGRDTAKRPKPHPDPYLEVLAELGAEASLSFAFEDSATGVAAAHAAGLRVIAVPNALTRTHDLSAAHLKLASLADFDLNAALEAR